MGTAVPQFMISPCLLGLRAGECYPNIPCLDSWLMVLDSMIILATFALNIGHPGLVIDGHKSQSHDVEDKQVGYRSDES